LSHGPAAVGLTLDHHASDAYSRRLEADKGGHRRTKEDKELYSLVLLR